MKIPSILLLLIICLNQWACMPGRTYHRYHARILKEVPLLEAPQKVDLYDPQSPLPNRAFDQVVEFRIKKGRLESGDQVLKRLHQAATQTGVDALIELRLEKRGPWDQAQSPDQAYGYAYYELLATGIRYKDNWQIESHVRTEAYYRYQSHAEHAFFTLHRYPSGKVKSILPHVPDARTFADQYLLPYDDWRLLKEKENWRYLLSEFGRLSHRRYYLLNKFTDSQLKIAYKRSGQMKELTLKHLENISEKTGRVSFKEKITYTYNTQGQLIEKRIKLSYRPDTPYLPEQTQALHFRFQYNTIGQHSFTEVYAQTKDQEQLVFGIRYTYFDPEDPMATALPAWE